MVVEDEVEVVEVVVDEDEVEVVVEMVVEVVVIAPVAPVVASENALPLYKRWEQQTHPSIHYLIQILSTPLTFRRLPRACSIF